MLSCHACRGLVGTGEFMFFSFGELLLVGLASHLTNWRHLTIAAGIIAAAPVLLYFFTPESARWLLSQGQHDKAVQILRKVARRNGTRLPQNLLLCSSSCDKAMGETADNRSCEGGALHEQDVMNKHSTAGSSFSGKAQQQQPAVYQHLSCSTTAAASSEAAASCSSKRDSKGSNHDVDRPLHKSTTSTQDKTDSRLSNIDQDLEEAAAAAAASPEKPKPAGFRVLLGNRMLATMSAVFALTWFTNFFAYYGITFGIGDIPGSM